MLCGRCLFLRVGILKSRFRFVRAVFGTISRICSAGNGHSLNEHAVRFVFSSSKPDLGPTGRLPMESGNFQRYWCVQALSSYTNAGTQAELWSSCQAHLFGILIFSRLPWNHHESTQSLFLVLVVGCSHCQFMDASLAATACGPAGNSTATETVAGLGDME